MHLLTVGAGGAGVEHEGVEVAVVHGFADVAVAANEEGDGMSAQLAGDGAGPLAWVSADVGHPNGDAFDGEALVLGIAQAEFLSVGIAPDDATGLAGSFEPVADVDIDDVAG